MRFGIGKVAIHATGLPLYCATAVGAVLVAFSGASAMAGLLYNPIVVQYGDGLTLSNTGLGVPAAVNLYNASVPNQSSPVSSATFNSSGGGLKLVVAANNSAEAALANNPTLANDAAQGIAYSGTGYAYLAGYNTSGGSLTAAADRSAGVVTVGPGLISSPTVLATQTAASAYNGSTIRSAVGDDTGPATPAIYTAGSFGGSNQPTAGWRNFTTNTQLYSGNANTRTTELLGGQLFGSMSSGSSVGVWIVNSTGGTPASGATPWIVTGTSSNHSPYEFALFNDSGNTNTSNGYNVAYIADDGNAGATVAGVEKWTYNGSAWTQAYVLLDSTLPSAAAAYHGLAGELDTSTGNAVLFATTKDGSRLQQITDPLGSTDPSNVTTDSYVTLATPGTNLWFRGVALAPAPVPEPGTVGLLIAGALGLATAAWRRGARAKRVSCKS
jgi:hypothetical protein